MWLRRQIYLLRLAILLVVAGEILRQHWYGPVTRQAHLRIFSRQVFGSEIRPLRVEPPTANRRMAGEAVPFGVTKGSSQTAHKEIIYKLRMKRS